ncbi:MAG: RraA family protein [Myxococcales bacterium]|nr:MAG: RraA family protein [Myxococcales bacterium]
MKPVVVIPCLPHSKLPDPCTLHLHGEPLFLRRLRKMANYEDIKRIYAIVPDSECAHQAEREEAVPLRRPLKAQIPSLPQSESAIRGKTSILQIWISPYYPFLSDEIIQKTIAAMQSLRAGKSAAPKKSEMIRGCALANSSSKNISIPFSVPALLDELAERGLIVFAANSFPPEVASSHLSLKPVSGAALDCFRVGDQSELALAGAISLGNGLSEARRFRVLRLFLTSPAASDVMDELGLPRSVLPPLYAPNFPEARLLGRAKTLKIRAAKKSDPPEAIYQALRSYSVVNENDVIVVGTEKPDLAYFGELNMSLAIASGASGAVIGGVTRDSLRTAKAGFPVFSKGFYCRDIKGKGAVETINTPIELDGVPVCPEDLVIGDRDGIVVVPRRRVAEVIRRCGDVLAKESRILSDILAGVAPENLLRRHGYF